MLRTIDTMARKPKPPTVTVRLEKELAKDVRIAAAANAQDVSDYLAGILRPIMSKELSKLGKTLSHRDKPAK